MPGLLRSFFYIEAGRRIFSPPSPPDNFDPFFFFPRRPETPTPLNAEDYLRGTQVDDSFGARFFFPAVPAKRFFFQEWAACFPFAFIY